MLMQAKPEKLSRTWAMPSPNTFDIPPIAEMVERYAASSKCSVDPFARNSKIASITNDLNPRTDAQHHMQAVDFIDMLAAGDVQCDLAILDPPYSPRQISECYKQAGLKCSQTDTQNARLYSTTKDCIARILTENAVVLSFGWNSVGMGKSRAFEIIEIMMVCHGGAHNDTICIAERRVSNPQMQLGYDTEANHKPRMPLVTEVGT